MPRKRWSEEQIVYAVKQSEAGRTAAEICRELGVSQQRSTRGRSFKLLEGSVSVLDETKARLGRKQTSEC